MKKIFITLLVLSMSVTLFAQDDSSNNASDDNRFVGKKIAVFSVGHQYDFDQNKRTMRASGEQAEALAQASLSTMSTMMSWYGGKVLGAYDPEYRALQGVVRSMDSDADFSDLERVSLEQGVDYVLLQDLVWMMYLDQLFIYEYQYKLLDVKSNVIDRKSAYFYVNALKDRDQSTTSKRFVANNIDETTELVSRITPRIWGITGLSKNGKKADLLSITIAGYYQNDVFRVYKLGGEQATLNGETKTFLTLTPLAKSTSVELEDPKIVISLDNKIEHDPYIIATAGNMVTAKVPGFEYPFIPITVVSLEGANDKSYDNHNIEITNYALYNAIHKNKMLKVLADPCGLTVAPMFECKLSNYSEAKNIIKAQLTVTNLADNSVIKNVAIESHTSNIDGVIASHINEVFSTFAAVGTIDKKQISFFVEFPIAYQEGEKFLLSLNDDNHTPIVIYELVSWNGQKYLFEESKVLDKNTNANIGKDPEAQYILSRYVEPIKDSKKDNSEFKKVASTNKLLDMIGK